MLEKELAYYHMHLPEWLETSSGKYVLIKEDELIGIFNSFDEALSNGARRFGLVSFLVRRITEEREEISIPALSLGILNANIT